MSNDDLELARHLFAKATALLEQAHEVAIAGQASTLSHDKLAGLTGALSVKANALQMIAATILIVCSDESCSDTPNNPI